MKTILEDKRKIKSIYWGVTKKSIREVGYCGVAKIEAYGEHGQMAKVPWFAIWKNDKTVERVNGARVVGVIYE